MAEENRLKPSTHPFKIKT